MAVDIAAADAPQAASAADMAVAEATAVEAVADIVANPGNRLSNGIN